MLGVQWVVVGIARLTFQQTVKIVAGLNFVYFLLEFVVARWIGSVSLFADSIDFLEDATVNLLIVVALGWNVRKRSFVGMLLALILLLPGVATLFTAWQKFSQPVVPDAHLLSLTGLGALAVNLFCAYLLARHRSQGGSLIKAAFLSARNDAVANVAMIFAGVLTVWTVSPYPDLIVGLGIFLMNLEAAREVYLAAQKERQAMP